MFQTSWFMISLLTELAVVLVLRTRKPAFRSRPSRLLLWSTLAVVTATFAIPFLGGPSTLFGFVPLSIMELTAVATIVLGYIVATEIAKSCSSNTRRQEPHVPGSTRASENEADRRSRYSPRFSCQPLAEGPAQLGRSPWWPRPCLPEHELIIRLATALTRAELMEDPQDLFANALRHATEGFSTDAQSFAPGISSAMGLIKLVLVVAVLMNRVWAYPAFIVAMIGFIVYQVYRMTFDVSFVLAAITVLDLIVLLLAWHEYGFLRRANAHHQDGHR